MAATRIAVSFAGRFTVAAAPVGSANAIVFSAEDNYAAAGWTAGSAQVVIQTASYVVLPWQASKVAATIGIQLRAGAPLRVRITRQSSAQVVIDCESVLVNTFREDDRVTLLEVAGSADTASEFEWLAVGT